MHPDPSSTNRAAWPLGTFGKASAAPLLFFKSADMGYATVLGVHFGLTPNAAGRFGGPRAQARFFL